jgi:predicted DNA-binding protein (UPF0251 family)
MAKFNWDRVARESRMWRASGDPMPSGGHAYDGDMRDTDPRRKERRAEPAGPQERADARRLGMSVEQLRAMRTRQAERLLQAEARRRGIKTKTLRRMIARGEAEHPMARVRKAAAKAAGEAGAVASRTKRPGHSGAAGTPVPVPRKKKNRLSGTGAARARVPVGPKKKGKSKSPAGRPDGRVAVALTRLDCFGILEYLAGKAGLPDATVRRLRTPLLSIAARRRAVRSARRTGGGAGQSDVALVYLDGSHDELVAATRVQSDKQPLRDVVRAAAEILRRSRSGDRRGARGHRVVSGPFPAANVSSTPFHTRRGARSGGVRIVGGGGSPGLGRRR